LTTGGCRDVKLSVLVGNPQPDSRTLKIADAVGEQVSRRAGAARVATIDLARHAEEIFQWPNDHMDELTRIVAESDVVVVATPTYKGTFTGLLKAFLDRYGTDGLAGVTAIPLMTAGSPLHGLAIEMGLRPLLVELGASVPTRGLMFLMSDMDRMDQVVESWAAANLRLPGLFAGPGRPDAAR
jgi:FMN reductase